MRIALAASLIVLVSACASTPPAPQSPIVAATATPAPGRWPGGARAAVSLTYDDAITSQIANAGPALAAHGLHGTFFLTGSSESLTKERDAWVALGRAGHELAVHTMYHPCPRAMDWVPKGFALEDYTPERMAKELDDSIALVHGLRGDEAPLTFAYPCGETYIGEGAGRTSYVPLVESRFLAGRAASASGIAMPGAFSFGQVPAVSDAYSSGPALVEWVKKAEAQGGWVVFIFHGVGAQYIVTPVEAQQALLDYLEKNKDTVWTAPFGTVAATLK